MDWVLMCVSTAQAFGSCSKADLRRQQFLEFKVVTADGKLKVANEVSNPDLFWALRGGGGGTWGVVTQATVKAYSSPKALLHLVAINSSTASLSSYANLNDGSDAAGLYDAMAYLGSQFPDMVDQGAGGIFITTPYGFLGGNIFIGDNATESHARSVWDPVLEKMSTFPGMQKAYTNTTSFPMYQDFFGYLWPTVGKNGDAAGTQSSNDASRKRAFAALDSQRYGGLFGKFVEAGLVQEQDLDQVWSFLDVVGSQDNPAFSKRSSQASTSWSDYTPNGDYNLPFSHGLLPMDNRLLARKHLEALPTSSFETKRQWASRFIIEIVAGPKTHIPKGDAVGVVPAWRETYISCYTPYLPPISSADILRQLAPDSGAYVNEVSACPRSYDR
jgi:hypothetical protein